MIPFDTDTLSHFSYGSESVRRRIAHAGAEPIAVTVVTRNEALIGRAASLLKAATEDELRTAVDRLRKTEKLLADFLIVGIDEAAVTYFGRLKKQKSLRKMGRADLLIACIALAHNALLVTRNVNDYKQVAGLRVENWVD